MIQSFRDDATRDVFEGRRVRRLPGNLLGVMQRKLKMVDAAIRLDDLRVPPGNRLERLKGNRKDQYSIRINDQWRVCFRWEADGPHRVEIVDYH